MGAARTSVPLRRYYNREIKSNVTKIEQIGEYLVDGYERLADNGVRVGSGDCEMGTAKLVRSSLGAGFYELRTLQPHSDIWFKLR